MESFIKNEFMNREYSWMQFNNRVLLQAEDKVNPLLERCKFLSIFSSNLDEFYMVRVGSLYNQSRVSPDIRENKTGLSASEQLDGIYAETKKLYRLSGEVFKSLRVQLKENGIKIVKAGGLTPSQRVECHAYYKAFVLPYLSPMVLDFKHPMIRFENMHSYFMYKLKKGDRNMIGIMPIPLKLPRLYKISGKKTVLITIEDILREFGQTAFEGYNVSCCALVRVTRNADFETNESDVDSEYNYDFSKYLKNKVEMRSSLSVVRLEIDEDSDDIKKFLMDYLNLKNKQCFTVKSYFDYKFMFELSKYIDKDDILALKFPTFKPHVAAYLADGAPLIDTVLKQDIYLSYPYDSMMPLIDLLDQCAADKDVVSIKITIYRLSSNSRIVDALKKASENGVRVTVVIELAARFDEENNLHFAEVLSEAGCTIIYGVGNYKVHSKIISIVLNKGDCVRYITHLGTGNYNESTAKQYTDLNIITADPIIGEDAAAFFRNLAIGNIEKDYCQLLIAPASLKDGLIKYVDREIEKAQRGESAEIIAKVNSLTDMDMIKKFIAASCAGVKVKLIVRGICCLVPGIVGKTENICVISIVGRFLEHSRVYCFGNEKDRRIYISSADLMTRNTDKRVEIATPILSKKIEAQIYRHLQLILSDNVKALQLKSNGKYEKVAAENEVIDSQAMCIEQTF